MFVQYFSDILLIKLYKYNANINNFLLILFKKITNLRRNLWKYKNDKMKKRKNEVKNYKQVGIEKCIENRISVEHCINQRK